jgi:hypothetical protein
MVGREVAPNVLKFTTARVAPQALGMPGGSERTERTEQDGGSRQDGASSRQDACGGRVRNARGRSTHEGGVSQDGACGGWCVSRFGVSRPVNGPDD